ncbi:aminotransferase class I/II-fold pyridoxal phosphate-dependent enzyme [Roseospira marina]|uniref:Aminotransferase n=1 Tax=Roseospira marina TaxID=140057 RepID=A0A5M6I9J6_9PROT|nr:aminotransferase class I/II-fold pyridoxal phosphate-dependent enzyme [Roseospira marina]KAA5604637.1 aminotransferase class I/II-fold pyridoxal phosphate-dependent enzyme [Roseospira marina]MBB4315079.1 aspartate/methionine/tyrosine aminotransferase [Roseospira marina]MBB5088151.1 aspartate/methionine/tyrosine aminotransferase [Roseospira marina]
MSLKVAERALVPPFIVMDVMSAAAAREATGERVLHLEVGQPSTGLPSAAAARLADRIATERLGYTVALGLPILRERIARYYQEAHGTTVSPDRILVTTGSSAAFQLAFLAAFAPGDRVGVAAPGYPAYRHILKALGVEPVTLPVGPDSRYQPTVAVLEASGERLDGLILASPSNPTGTVIPPEDLRALTAWCDDRGVRLISDEIYHGIVYGEPALSAAGLTPNALVINSFSKYYAMTGWRLGWMVAPPDMIRPLECLAQNMFISAPTLSQYAGLYAMDCIEELEANVARYAANRALLLKTLPKAGFDRLAPADGAFYLYADVSRLTNDSADFCARMLRETGVAATPGLDFDAEQGHRFVRFSFAGATDDMEEAADRLTAWMGRIGA